MKVIKEHEATIFEEKMNAAIAEHYVLEGEVKFQPAVVTSEAMVEESFFYAVLLLNGLD